jgi:hypothetical protein
VQVARVIEEDHAGGARRILWLAQQRSDDGIGPAWLVDGHPAETVGIALETLRAFA